MKQIHDLKIDHTPFCDVVSGLKTAEVRFNDRGFRIGDTLRLCETRRSVGRLELTGKHVTRVLSHIQEGYGLPPGYVVLSFVPVERYLRPDPSIQVITAGDVMRKIEEQFAKGEFARQVAEIVAKVNSTAEKDTSQADVYVLAGQKNDVESETRVDGWCCQNPNNGWAEVVYNRITARERQKQGWKVTPPLAPLPTQDQDIEILHADLRSARRVIETFQKDLRQAQDALQTMGFTLDDATGVWSPPAPTVGAGRQRVRQLQVELDLERKRLDYVIHNRAYFTYGKDGEVCSMWHLDDAEDESDPLVHRRCEDAPGSFRSQRPAIDHAIAEQEKRRKRGK